MPVPSSRFTPEESKQIVILIRLHLNNRGLLHRAQAIREHLLIKGVRPAPSISTIKRILSRNNLTYGRLEA